MKIGTKVRLKIPCLGNEAGVFGVCYDVYMLDGRNGSSIIFQNGEYDGFCEVEQEIFLEILEDTPFRYSFTNVMRLCSDFDKGVFNEVLGINQVGRLYT